MNQTTDGKQREQLESATAESDRVQRAEESRATSITLVAYPKIVFLYPTFLVALIAAGWMWVTGRHAVAPTDLMAVVITWVFLGVLGMNIIVLAFDFPRATSLTIFFVLTAAVLAVILTANLRPEVLPLMAAFLQRIRPVANATFFTVVAALFLLIYLAVLVGVRFDYWEVRPNELLHHHGVLSDLERFSAPNLRIDKEINDVFEYILLRSGRLILQPSGERRAIILDNVPFISQKEIAITRMLGALQVEVRPDSN